MVHYSTSQRLSGRPIRQFSAESPSHWYWEPDLSQFPKGCINPLSSIEEQSEFQSEIYDDLYRFCKESDWDDEPPLFI
jgi:hypothetical protein